MRKSRLTADQKKWRKEHALYELIGKLDDVPYTAEERRERHEKLQAIKDDSYQPPPRTGHAQPRGKWEDSPGGTVLGSIGAVRKVEGDAIRADNSKDRKADREAEKWMRDNGFDW